MSSLAKELDRCGLDFTYLANADVPIAAPKDVILSAMPGDSDRPKLEAGNGTKALVESTGKLPSLAMSVV